MAEPNSKDNLRLKKALSNYPEADANKDGILTLSEIKVYFTKDRQTKNKNVGLDGKPSLKLYQKKI